jgi:hypothetical protein
MGQAIPVRTDYTAGEVRRFAKRAKHGAQARRLLAIAAVLDGTSPEDAADPQETFRLAAGLRFWSFDLPDGGLGQSTLLPLLAHSMHRPTTGPQGAGSPCGQFDSIKLIKLGRPMFCGLP